MLLSNLEINQEAQIKQINCGDELKQRFYSFGLIKGTTIIVDEISLARNTMAVNIDGTEIALRIEEAEQIEVEAL
jgi:ferrous iron transport protein A